jgi:hypothetical protein
MARSRFSICLLAMTALCMAAAPGFAQFGSIFRDDGREGRSPATFQS